MKCVLMKAVVFVWERKRTKTVFFLALVEL